MSARTPSTRLPLRILVVVVLAAVAVLLWAVFSRSGGEAVHAKGPLDVEQARADAVQYFNHGKLGQAQSLLENIVKQEPRDAEAHIFLGEVLLGRRKVDEAYRSLSRGLEINASHEQGRFLAGVVAATLGRAGEAADHYRRAAEMSPDNPKYAIYLGTALLDLGKLDEAEAQSRKARGLDAGLPEVYLLQAGVEDHRGRFDEAIREINRGLELLPETDHRYLSYSLFKSGTLRRSERAGEAVSLLNGLDARHYGQGLVAELAQCHLALNQPAKAAGAWAELFALEPGNARAAAEVGLCLVTAGEPGQARRYLGYARAVDPRHASVQVLEAAIAQAVAR